MIGQKCVCPQFSQKCEILDVIEIHMSLPYSISTTTSLRKTRNFGPGTNNTFVWGLIFDKMWVLPSYPSIIVLFVIKITS